MPPDHPLAGQVADDDDQPVTLLLRQVGAGILRQPQVAERAYAELAEHLLQPAPEVLPLVDAIFQQHRQAVDQRAEREVVANLSQEVLPVEIFGTTAR